MELKNNAASHTAGAVKPTKVKGLVNIKAVALKTIQESAQGGQNIAVSVWRLF